ncbi:MAG: lytic transglycosylase domain-containing protein [Acetobacteraceae bacterium]
MPATARSLGVADRFDIEQNLRGGIAFIAHLLDLYRGNLGLALAAYNAGPAAVDACACVPNNGETVEYVNRVRSLYDSVMHRPRMGTAG